MTIDDAAVALDKHRNSLYDWRRARPPGEVRRARILFDHLLERALSPEDSVALIEQIIAEYE